MAALCPEKTLWLSSEDGVQAPDSQGERPRTPPAATREKYLLKGQAERLGRQRDVTERALKDGCPGVT